MHECVWPYMFLFFLTLLQSSISSSCPTGENGLHIDPHRSIHAVPPTHNTKAQTLRTAGYILLTTLTLVTTFYWFSLV